MAEVEESYTGQFLQEAADRLTQVSTLLAIEVGTSQGPALLDWTAPAVAPVTFVMALTHGAGGTTNAPDLHAARDAAVQLGGGVALVTQPYRVRGARAPARPSARIRPGSRS